MAAAAACVIIILFYCERYYYKQPCRTSILTGREYIREVLTTNVNPTWVYDVFRMSSQTVHLLLRELSARDLLDDSTFVSKEEKLAMFISIVSKGSTNRTVQERFQHSGETVSR